VQLHKLASITRSRWQLRSGQEWLVHGLLKAARALFASVFESRTFVFVLRLWAMPWPFLILCLNPACCCHSSIGIGLHGTCCHEQFSCQYWIYVHQLAILHNIFLASSRLSPPSLASSQRGALTTSRASSLELQCCGTHQDPTALLDLKTVSRSYKEVAEGFESGEVGLKLPPLPCSPRYLIPFRAFCL
jgi:hypothetical protein